MITSCSFVVRGLFGDTLVSGWRVGEWAVSRQLATPSLFCLTFLPLGFSLPFTWASFDRFDQASAAMREIARLKNSWSQITQEDLTKELEQQLKVICFKHGAVSGPNQLPIGAEENGFGLATRERVNGYHHPGVS